MPRCWAQSVMPLDPGTSGPVDPREGARLEVGALELVGLLDAGRQDLGRRGRGEGDLGAALRVQHHPRLALQPAARSADTVRVQGERAVMLRLHSLLQLRHRGCLALRPRWQQGGSLPARLRCASARRRGALAAHSPARALANLWPECLQAPALPRVTTSATQVCSQGTSLCQAVDTLRRGTPVSNWARNPGQGLVSSSAAHTGAREGQQAGPGTEGFKCSNVQITVRLCAAPAAAGNSGRLALHAAGRSGQVWAG